MIRNSTTRKTLYDYHSGVWSETYADNTSGLVSDFNLLIDDLKD